MDASFKTSGEYKAANLIAGNFPRVERKLTIAAGTGELLPGAVFALEGDGKAVLVDSASVTPSVQNPVGILAHEVDALDADAEAIVYYAGEFNELELTFGGTDDADTHRDALRRLGIFLTTNIGA